MAMATRAETACANMRCVSRPADPNWKLRSKVTRKKEEVELKVRDGEAAIASTRGRVRSPEGPLPISLRLHEANDKVAL